MTHPRFRRYKKLQGYTLTGEVRNAITQQMQRMVMNGPTGTFIRHLQLEFGKDAVSAYREEVL